jgi:hypothetical protein
MLRLISYILAEEEITADR